MDSDEEEGLRAFALRVEAYAGASSPERPMAVELDGRRVEVERVEARWREEERIGFRVRLRGGQSALLYYVPELDLWSGVWARGGEGSMIVRRRS
jgi:hypothetical protein